MAERPQLVLVGCGGGCRGGLREWGTMDVDTVLKVIVGAMVGLLFAAKPAKDFIRQRVFPNRKKSK